MRPWLLRRAKAVFLAALEQEPGDHRAVYLNEACGDNEELRRKVERLLAIHDRNNEFLEQPAIEWVADLFMIEDNGGDLTGQTVGPYKVLHRLGAGGMGEVWLAEDDPRLERKVALKFLRVGGRGNHSLAC